jgi:glucokinase
MQHKYRALYGHSLLPLFEQEAGTLTVRFMHDSNAFLLGEIQNPLYRRFKKPCAVLVGTGLGFALMEEGRILTNETGGPKVSIFSRPYRDATSEEYLSKRASMRLYQQLGGTTCTTVKELDILAHRGDELCRRVFALTAVHAAEILYPIIAHHAIDCIILGGQIAKADELLVLPLQERLHALGVDCFVGKAHTIDAAPLVGAAHLFEEQ